MNVEKKIKVFQKGFNYSQDGRGNRLVFHLQGCNMKCPWCSNPEGMSLQGTNITEKGRTRLSCKEYTIEELVKESVRSKPMFFDGGGVTLTGGEISMQFEAVTELLKKLKEESIHTAIETNGSHPRMEELIPYVDQWIMDVKHYDEAKHREWVGVSLENTTKTLRKVTKTHKDVLVRVPLIPGFNDSKEDAGRFAMFFCENIIHECKKNESTGDREVSTVEAENNNAGNENIKTRNVQIEFLAYHEFGKQKWEQCGMEYKMPNRRLAPGTVKLFENISQEKGMICVRT